MHSNFTTELRPGRSHDKNNLSKSMRSFRRHSESTHNSVKSTSTHSIKSKDGLSKRKSLPGSVLHVAPAITKLVYDNEMGSSVSNNRKMLNPHLTPNSPMRKSLYGGNRRRVWEDDDSMTRVKEDNVATSSQVPPLTAMNVAKHNHRLSSHGRSVTSSDKSSRRPPVSNGSGRAHTDVFARSTKSERQPTVSIIILQYNS